MNLIGKTIGNYQIIEELGRGGMAVVYRAYQSSLNRYVAIKVLPPQLGFDQQFIERFQREARAAAGLRHPNIVVIHDVGQH
ncbi:MAG TPA: protein kinase, partial [Anaerolineae bacterium]|nr:protein kinase [Anaerolineae bacterium]